MPILDKPLTTLGIYRPAGQKPFLFVGISRQTKNFLFPLRSLWLCGETAFLYLFPKIIASRAILTKTPFLICLK
jgi:hypothetical protein